MHINRAPVLTLWAVVVAERLGYKQDTALTLGKALAGLNAQSKGRALGIFEAKEKENAEKESPGLEVEFVELMGRSIPVTRGETGFLAVEKGKPGWGAKGELDVKKIRRLAK